MLFRSFVSKIPPGAELAAAIQKRINEKLKLRIRSKKSELIIFEDEEGRSPEIRERVNRAMTELGRELDIRVVSGKDQMAWYGISQSPAVVAVKYNIKSEGVTPSVEVIKEWVKEL